MAELIEGLTAEQTAGLAIGVVIAGVVAVAAAWTFLQPPPPASGTPVVTGTAPVSTPPAPSPPAPTQEYNEEATVTDTSGNPVAFALVSFTPSLSATTGSAGTVQIPNIPAATYQVSISATGYVTSTEPVTVSGDRSDTFVLTDVASSPPSSPNTASVAVNAAGQTEAQYEANPTIVQGPLGPETAPFVPTSTVQVSTCPAAGTVVGGGSIPADLTQSGQKWVFNYVADGHCGQTTVTVSGAP